MAAGGMAAVTVVAMVAVAVVADGAAAIAVLPPRRPLRLPLHPGLTAPVAGNGRAAPLSVAAIRGPHPRWKAMLAPMCNINGAAMTGL